MQCACTCRRLHAMPRRDRPGREFLDAVLSTLRGDGSVLVPVDTAGRVLELVLLLERAWADARLTYPLVLLSPMVRGGWLLESHTPPLGRPTTPWSAPHRRWSGLMRASHEQAACDCRPHMLAAHHPCAGP